MRDVIRASSLQGFDRLVTELGGDPAPLLRAVDLPVDLGRRPDATLAYSALAALLAHAADALECPDFGLRLARHQSIEMFGAVALVARYAATATEALDGLRRYTRYYSPAFEVDLRQIDAERSRYTFAIVVPGVRRPAQVLELSLGVSLDLFRILLGDAFGPRDAFLPHAPLTDPATYRAFFGCTVRFDATACGFDIDHVDLGRRREGDDPHLRRLAERYLDGMAAGPPVDDLASRVRVVVGRLLPTGQTSLVSVADHLGLHPRTLQRRLATHGTGLETLVDDVRRERAEHYLRDTVVPLSVVATMLGYSEQSALTRAARRWFGRPPRDVRRGPPGR